MMTVSLRFFLILSDAIFLFFIKKLLLAQSLFIRKLEDAVPFMWNRFIFTFSFPRLRHVFIRSTFWFVRNSLWPVEFLLRPCFVLVSHFFEHSLLPLVAAAVDEVKLCDRDWLFIWQAIHLTCMNLDAHSVESTCKADECKRFPILKTLINATSSHVCEPVFGFRRQVRCTVILARCNDHEAGRNFLVYKCFEFLWWLVCIKHLRRLHFAIAGVHDHNMQTSIVVVLILFALYRDVVDGYWSEVALIESSGCHLDHDYLFAFTAR